MNIASKEIFKDQKSGSFDYELDSLTTAPQKAQYIDTGLFADQLTGSSLKFEGKCKFNTRYPDPSSTYGPYLFGGYGTNVGGITCQTTANDGGQWKWQFRYGTGSKYAYPGTPATGTTYDVEAFYSAAKSYLKVNGSTLGQYSSGGPYDHAPIGLFCVYNSNAWLLRYSNVTMLGHWKFWIGDILAREFIPCVKDKVVCLYDTVSQSFFYNKGIGDFIAGGRI